MFQKNLFQNLMTWPIIIHFLYVYMDQSIPGQVIPKTQKVVLDASLLNTQHCKVWIKGKEVDIGVVTIEKRAFRSPLTMVTNFF